VKASSQDFSNVVEPMSGVRPFLLLCFQDKRMELRCSDWTGEALKEKSGR